MVLDELNKGSESAALAKEKSADIISARNGGDMGWLEDATIPDKLKNAGLKEKGQLSGVIKSSVGFLIVRLDDIQPAKVKSLDEVRGRHCGESETRKSPRCVLCAAAESERCGKRRRSLWPVQSKLRR